MMHQKATRVSLIVELWLKNTSVIDLSYVRREAQSMRTQSHSLSSSPHVSGDRLIELPSVISNCCDLNI